MVRSWARMAGPLVAPTALAVALDVVLRGRIPFGGAYLLAVLTSAALWAGPIEIARRLGSPRGRIAVAFALAPFVAMSFAGQALHYRVFHAYMARDSVRYGLANRATVMSWLAQVGGGLGIAILVLAGLAIALLVTRLASRARPVAPLFAIAATASAVLVLSFDRLDTRGEQAAPPDVAFAHGVVHAVRMKLTSHERVQNTAGVRTPARLPPLTAPAHRPNVLFVITESVRADALCSDPPPACRARFLDEVAPDRLALGKLTTQSPGTVTACVMLWTGLDPDADHATMHAAPTIWELARAIGYRTAYVSAQNVKGEDFGAFVEHAGLDVRVSGSDLGGVLSDTIGAPDERAMDRTLAFVRETREPWLAVLHLSNTHSPYRVDASLEPNHPHSYLPIGGMEAYRNHYRNAVLLQERSFAAFLRELRASPAWDDTAVVFVSDHGEQLLEHGGLYHLRTLYDEEIRTPGFVVAGARALGPEARARLASIGPRRTYTRDVHATIIDLLGLADTALPFAALRTGRSLLRPISSDEPMAPLSIASAVWESDGSLRGVMRGESLLVDRGSGQARECFDMRADPEQRRPLAEGTCPGLASSLR